MKLHCCLFDFGGSREFCLTWFRWEPHLKGIVVLWVHSPPTVQQLLNEVTTKLKSCLNLSSLPEEVANSTFSCHKAFRLLHANSSVLGFQRAGHSSHYGRQ